MSPLAPRSSFAKRRRQLRQLPRNQNFSQRMGLNGYVRFARVENPSMKQQPQVRLSWRPIFMVVGFAAFAFGMISVDWSEAQAQEVKAKAKAKAKDLPKKALDKKANKKK